MPYRARNRILAVVHTAFFLERIGLRVERELFQRLDPACCQRPDFLAFPEDGDGALQHRWTVSRQDVISAYCSAGQHRRLTTGHDGESQLAFRIFADVRRKEAAAIDAEGGYLSADTFVRCTVGELGINLFV